MNQSHLVEIAALLGLVGIGVGFWVHGLPGIGIIAVGVCLLACAVVGARHVPK